MEQNKPADNFFTKAFRDHKIPSWWAVAGIIFLFINIPISIFIFAFAGYTLYKEKNPGGKFTLVKLIVWIAIIGIFSSIVLASLNSARIKGQAELDNTNQNNQTTNTPVASTQSDQTKNSSGPVSSFSDGTYIVNKDINPGTYKNSDSSKGCYWGRLSNFTGNNDMIANDFTYANAIVTIKSTDVGFKTTGCGTWSQIQTPASIATTKSTSPTVNIKPTSTPTDWTTYTSLPANFLKNPPYYIGTKVKLSGTVTDFLASGDRGGDTNYISIISSDPAAPSQQFMLEIDSSANYQKVVSSVNKLNAVIAYGTIEKTTAFTKYSTNGTIIVPVVNIARLDACTSLLICTSDDKTLQTVFPAGITQTSGQNSQTTATTPTLPPPVAYKGRLNDILSGIKFFVGTPQEYTPTDTDGQPTSGNKFVLEFIQINNQSTSQINYSPLDFVLVDPNGGQYNKTYSAQSNPTFSSGTLNSGGNVSGNIIYEVPVGTSASSFTIHYDNYIGSTHVVTDFK